MTGKSKLLVYLFLILISPANFSFAQEIPEEDMQSARGIISSIKNDLKEQRETLDKMQKVLEKYPSINQ